MYGKPDVFFELDKNGFFSVAKRGVMKPQYCPHAGGIKRCGDWCPLFSGPGKETGGGYGGKPKVRLDNVWLCLDSAVSGTLIDNRPQGEYGTPKPEVITPAKKTSSRKKTP